MAPAKSPPLAFEPAPETIFPDTNKENFSPFDGPKNKLAINGRSHEHSLREVRFSPMTTPTRRAQSLATDVPLLEPISSASPLPRRSVKLQFTTSAIDVEAYVEESRSLLENQRKHFKKERSFFDQERKLWDVERSMLKAQITDLELKLSKVGGLPTSGRKPSRGASTSSNFDATRASFSYSRDGSTDVVGPADYKFWEKPDMGGTVTRVFSNESYSMRQSEGYLPSITESPSSPRQKSVQILSPTKTDQSMPAVSIPIEKIDSSLDGITIKSTGLPPSKIKTIVSPTDEPPLITSSPEAMKKTKDDHRLQIDVEQATLSPFPENLTKNAGHTPMARVESIENSIEGETSKQSPPILDPQEPFSPGPTIRPPTERSNSYFPAAEGANDEACEERDVELKGPLIMESEGRDNAFLSALDQKLEAEAHKAESSETQEITAENIETGKRPEPDDEGPKLRIKQSMNFGSAWGSSAIGKGV